MATIFVVGNPLLEEDSLPIRILPKLLKAFPDLDFREIDPTEDLRILGRRPVLIDAVVGPNKVVVLKDLETIEDGPHCSLHDMDLGMSLKLMKKMGLMDSVTIIGIPVGISESDAVKGISPVLRAVCE
ncbi:MAG: hypothetical protein ABIH90_03295 [Candidatus Aenigmatarchaeota archaeon]